jgi:hypothetical protein
MGWNACKSKYVISWTIDASASFTLASKKAIPRIYVDSGVFLRTEQFSKRLTLVKQLAVALD